MKEVIELLKRLLKTTNAQSSAPSDNFFAITPSNTVALPQKVRAIKVGVGGDLALVNASGVTVIVKVQDGDLLPVCTTQVKSTGTTATNLVGLV